jgi:hypothetical protein
MTTPTQRITRLLEEGARFMVELPGHVAIDLTADVIAAMDEVQPQREGFEPGRNLFEPTSVGRDLRTHVQFP